MFGKGAKYHLLLVKSLFLKTGIFIMKNPENSAEECLNLKLVMRLKCECW